jgi:flavodoxin I
MSNYIRSKTKKIGLFYGSAHGDTKRVAELIKKKFGRRVRVHDVSASTAEDLKKYDFLIMGLPTYHVGEMEDSWYQFMPKLDAVDFHNKKVALFCLGSQVFPMSFAGAMAILYNTLKIKGATLVGACKTDGYLWKKSSAMVGGVFCGLIIDELIEPEETGTRVSAWVKQLKKEFA